MRAALTILWVAVVGNYVTHDDLHRQPREPYRAAITEREWT